MPRPSRSCGPIAGRLPSIAMSKAVLSETVRGDGSGIIDDAAPLPPHGAERTTSFAELDRAVSELWERARPFARIPAIEKAGLVRQLLARWMDSAYDVVIAGCRAKRIELDAPTVGEEWLAGAYPTAQALRIV